MQPSLIKRKDAKQQKITAWMNGIDQTGYMRTSAIPDVESLLEVSYSAHIAIEAIDFNQHICPDLLRKVVDSSCFTLHPQLVILDFGRQHVDCHLLDTILAWLDAHQVEIKQLNLATLSHCPSAWKRLVAWMTQTQCKIRSIDLGKMSLTLSMVKDIVGLLLQTDAGIERLDFGYSHWHFSAMKTLLWGGALSAQSSLRRLALGDARFCAHSLRLLMQYLCRSDSPIQVFSTGVVDLPETLLASLLDYVQRPDCGLQSLVLSHQSCSNDVTRQLAQVLGYAQGLRHLALINCWLDHQLFAEVLQQGVVAHLYIEAITAGHIQQYTAMFLERGYVVDRELSRYRIRLKLQ